MNFQLKNLVSIFLIVFLVLQLNGCSTKRSMRDRAPNFPINAAKTPDAVPKIEPLSRFGNPKSYVAKGKRYYIMKSSKGYCQRGVASWYGMRFHKVRTSSGEPYNVAAMTAAHCTLPIPTYVQVTNLKNGKRVIVKVNDRGPFSNNRLIDLSYVAAVKLGMSGSGTAPVEVKALNPRTFARSESVEQPPHSTQVAERAPKLKHSAPYIQVGVFTERRNAEQLTKRVKSKTHYPVFVKCANPHGQALYRVQIGPLPTVKQSQQLARQLRSAGLGKPVVLTGKG